MVDLSPAAHRRALKLQRDLLQRKIASVEEEIVQMWWQGRALDRGEYWEEEEKAAEEDGDNEDKREGGNKKE